MKFQEFDFEKGLIDEKTYENVLIYNNSCRTLIDPKPLRIRFDKIVVFSGFYNESWYLILFGPGNSDALCIRIRYLQVKKVVSHMLFVINTQELKLIHMILCLLTKR